MRLSPSKFRQPLQGAFGSHLNGRLLKRPDGQEGERGLKSVRRPDSRKLAPGTGTMLRLEECGGIASGTSQSEKSKRGVLGSPGERYSQPIEHLVANGHTGFYADFPAIDTACQ